MIKRMLHNRTRTVNFMLLMMLLLIASANAQVSLSKTQTGAASNENQNRAALSCTAPAALNYTLNNAFYCTGIPISTNMPTYTGTTATSFIVSPDLPIGLTFNTLTGAITGTPTEAVLGNYNVMVINPCGTSIKIIYISVSSGTNYYTDSDGDGAGAGAAIISCTGPPEGTTDNNFDCAPTDATKWRAANFYTDADGDGYNNGFPRTNICYGAVAPSGYTSVNIGTDCDDTNKFINPNHEEILGNGKDDNCDGFIDEVTTTSNLIPSSCGVTVPSLSSTLWAQAIPGAQGYRFEVTNGANIKTYETNVNRFNLLNLTPGVTFSSTNVNNSVKVSVKTGGFWRSYGTACSVTSPAVPNSTSVSYPPCGSYVTDVSNSIFCYNNPIATYYRFRVKDGATLVGTYDSPVNRFNLANLGVANIVFPTTYTIDVLLQIGGVWLSDAEYGNTCTISSPPNPGMSKIVSPSCGSSINSIWTNIFALQVVGAQGYKFVFTNGIQSREVIQPGSSFNLHNIPGGLVIGTTYIVRVDVLYNNYYVPGLETCTLIILPTATRHSNHELDVFEVKSYPNPFENSFKLDIKTSSEERVAIKVYDLLGRTVDNLEGTVAAITAAAIGNNYPSGVYNVAISQGENVKTLRLVKR